MTRVFLGEVHTAKRTALQIRADLVRREEEYVQCREQAALFEEQLTDQAQKYLELQGALQTTSLEFTNFKERHFALQSEL